MGGAHGYFFVPAAALISPRSLSQRTLRRTSDLFTGDSFPLPQRPLAALLTC
jgi:hypothetical protein